MTDTKVISPERGFTNPHLSSLEEYKRLYEQSINDPVTFFQNAAKENLVWSKPFTTTFNNQFKNAKWFEDGELNICLLYTSPSPRDATLSRMPSSA